MATAPRVSPDSVLIQRFATPGPSKGEVRLSFDQMSLFTPFVLQVDGNDAVVISPGEQVTLYVDQGPRLFSMYAQKGRYKSQPIRDVVTLDQVLKYRIVFDAQRSNGFALLHDVR